MTKEEFMGFIEDQKKSGKSEEDITKIFCLMFQEDELDREQFEAVLAVMGYELSDEYKKLSDDELKEKILVKNDDASAKEGADVEGAKEDKEGDKPPMAKKGEEKEEDEKFAEEGEEEERSKEEPKEEEEEEEEEESESDSDDGEEEEWKSVKKNIFGLKD